MFMWGDYAFSVGKVKSNGHSGTLRADSFGNVYVGDYAFSVGTVDSHGYSGELRANAFGEVYVGDCAFSVGTDKLFISE